MHEIQIVAVLEFTIIRSSEVAKSDAADFHRHPSEDPSQVT